MNLLAGTGISPVNTKGAFTGFIVNETLVRSLGLTPQQAIGKEIAINEGKAPITGVVADFHNVPLREEIEPCLMFNWFPDFLWEAGIKIRTDNVAYTLEFVEKTWREFFPQSVYRYQFLQDYLTKIYAIDQLLLLFIKAAAALAIIIGCLGLYGLVTFSTVRRTKEIGVRRVLGASYSHLINMFSYEYLLLIGLAFLIAAPLSWYAIDHWLAGFAYRVDMSIGVFLITLMMVLLVAIVTIGLRLWQVIRINPAETLRSE